MKKNDIFMRKANSIKIILLVILLAMASASLPTITARASRSGKWVYFGKNKNAITKKWDLNGDGKKETVRLAVSSNIMRRE